MSGQRWRHQANCQNPPGTPESSGTAAGLRIQSRFSPFRVTKRLGWWICYVYVVNLWMTCFCFWYRIIWVLTWCVCLIIERECGSTENHVSDVSVAHWRRHKWSFSTESTVLSLRHVGKFVFLCACVFYWRERVSLKLKLKRNFKLMFVLTMWNLR